MTEKNLEKIIPVKCPLYLTCDNYEHYEKCKNGNYKKCGFYVGALIVKEIKKEKNYNSN